MNVNEKGDIGVAKIIADLTTKSYYCYVPLSGSSPVDLIVADENMIMKRLQIKYRNESRDKISVGFCSVVNGKKIKISLDKIDGWGVYCPENNQIYYIDKRNIDLSKTGFSFRIREPKQKQHNVSPMGDIYLDESKLWQEI